jgi:hypothetical protein
LINLPVNGLGRNHKESLEPNRVTGMHAPIADRWGFFFAIIVGFFMRTRRIQVA